MFLKDPNRLRTRCKSTVRYTSFGVAWRNPRLHTAHGPVIKTGRTDQNEQKD
jgi:hypothetical protein